MFKSITVKPLLWTILALTIALGVLAVLYHARGVALDGMNDKVTAAQKVQKQAEANLDAAVETNKKNKAVIEDLALRYATLVGQNQAITEANEKATAQRDAAARARDKATFELARLKETIYATDPTCAAWGSQPVCPAIGDRLRDLWNHEAAGDGNAADRSSGPSAGLGGSDPTRDSADVPGAGAGHPAREELRQPQGLFFEQAAGGHAVGSVVQPRQGGG